MEKIKTYDMTELMKASRTLSTALEPDWRNRLNMANYRNRTTTLDVAEGMYEAHKEWVESKFQPLLPYLERNSAQGSRPIKEGIVQHYSNGLRNYSAFRGRETNFQDAIVDYTGRFVNMLKTCEQLEISPKVGLALAEQSHTKGRKDLVRFFQENETIAKLVMKRADAKVNPSNFLQSYFFQRDRIEDVSKEAYKDVPSLRTELGDLYKRAASRGDFYEIEGVPTLRQRHTNWCGNTSVAMVVQHLGYNDITPEKIFRYTNGEYDMALESVDPDHGPDVDSLALAVTNLTPLQARIIEEKDYAELCKKNPAFDSPYAVLKTFVQRGIPCIVRIPGHFMVVKGFDKKTGDSIVNNPYEGETQLWKAQDFENLWAEQDLRYRRNTSHLMLAIYPRRDKKS